MLSNYRTRSGVVPPLATRATRAAWPADDTNNSRPSSNPVPQSATPLQADNQGMCIHISLISQYAFQSISSPSTNK